jgi:hypothetical protein
MIETIGKPVFHRYSSDLYGSWLMDSLASEENDAKVWETRSESNQTLFEYVNKTMFRANIPTRNYTLPFPFTVQKEFKRNSIREHSDRLFPLQGNDHVVYNGSFFYFHLASESIIRFEMSTRNAKRLKIPRNSIVINYGGDLLTKLYNSKQVPYKIALIINHLRSHVAICLSPTAILTSLRTRTAFGACSPWPRTTTPS